MRLLLDTHAFIWWLAGSDQLPDIPRKAIWDSSNDVLISAASAWEITAKYRLGKLPSAEQITHDVSGAIAGEGFIELPITVDDAARAGALPGLHRDPFDRILISQSLTRDLVLVSNESLFDSYGVRRLW